MMLPLAHLLRLPVYTRSGARLGCVTGGVLDSESQSVVQYEVRKNIFAKKLLVHREQVVSISDERMVVDDAVVGAQKEPVCA